MTLSVDSVIDRIRLKKAIGRWRSLALLLLVVIVMLSARGMHLSFLQKQDHIARVAIEGLILEDTDRLTGLSQLRDDETVKAVVVYINSPGGSIVGGESLNRILSDVAKHKPVVVAMGGVATSGGYMAAVASDYIVAYEGTITGSIGVLLQSVEVTQLAHKLGIELVTLKTDELKGAPLPTEKLTPQALSYLQETLQQGKTMFVQVVARGRKLPEAEVQKLADGRIYLGKEAVKLKLIDAIGTEEDAVRWLKVNKKLDKSLEVRPYSFEKKTGTLEMLFSSVVDNKNYVTGMFSGGLMTLWSPTR